MTAWLWRPHIRARVQTAFWATLTVAFFIGTIWAVGIIAGAPFC